MTVQQSGETGRVVVNPNPPVAAPRQAQSETGRVVTNPTPIIEERQVPQSSTGRVVVNPDAPAARTDQAPTGGVNNTPFVISIDSQSDTTRPFAASNYTPDGQFVINVTDGDCSAATYTVQAAPVAASGPGGSTPVNTTITAYIGFPDQNFLFDSAGAGDYDVTVTEISGTCSFAPGDDVRELTVSIGEGPLDEPFSLTIETQVDTTRPFAASNYTADGSFTMRTTDPATCNGTFTVNASPIAGSGPAGSTPPATIVTTYIGFPDGTFFFGNAGAGDYTVTATETGSQCVTAPGDDQQVLVVTVDEGPLDPPYSVSVASQNPTSLPFADPAYAPDGDFTMAVADNGCTGTYTVNATPVSGSGPEGSTPPSTAVMTYIGFGQGSFLFDNAGIGDYTVTVTETGNCTFDPAKDPTVQTITVVGNQPILEIAPGVQDFGDVEVDTTSPVASVTLSNTGTGNLLVSSLDAAAAPFDAAGGTCGGIPITIPEGNSCTLDYSFSPTASGPASQVLALESTSVPSAGSFELQGNGTQAVATLDLTSLILGPVTAGSGDTGTVTVTSEGNVDLVITDITDPAAPFSISGGDCLPLPTTLADGESCTIEVLFLPGSAEGNFNSSFDIVSNAGSSPDTVDLQGTSQAVLVIPTLSIGGLIALALVLMLLAAGALRKRMN